MSFSEFIHMSGYGLYVWSSFGMTILVFIIELISLRRAQSAALREIRKTRQLNGNSS